MRRALLFFSILIISPVLVRAETNNINPILHVGQIIIERGNVFDLSVSSQNRIPYTWANAFHVITEEDFIRQELLFKEGDPYNPNLLKESERILRSRPVFRRVTITPDPPVGGNVNIRIRTDDVWTTSLDAGFGTAGGKNFYRLGALEHNFLGTGSSIGAFVRQDIDRFIRGATYEDPQLLGTHWNVFTGYGKDQKGQEWEMDLARYYDSVLTPYSAGGTIHISNDEDRLFENGDEAEFFQHKTISHRLFASAAVDANSQRAHRVGLAYEDQTDRFSDIRLVEPEPTPVDRRVAAVLMTYRYYQSDFEKRYGLHTFDRDEDINFGWDFLTEIGPEVSRFGASHEGALTHTQLTRIWRTSDQGYLYTGTIVEGRLEHGTIQNGVLKLNIESVLPDIPFGGIATFRGRADAGKNLPAETQFLLGGENGLRAYSVRQFSGNKKILFTAENRWNLWYDWLQLANIGWATFVDSGGVWHDGEAVRFADFKNDVGAGLRIAPSRSYSAGLIRFDVAYAMNDNDRRSRWTVNIGGEVRFGEESKKKFDQ